MILLKQLIHFTDTNSVEATWVDRTALPNLDVPAVAAVLDEEGSEVSPAIPAYTITGRFEDVQVRCHSYSDRQMDMLRADLGADAAGYADLIAEVEANMRPIVPPTAAQLAATAQAEADSLAKTQAKTDAVVQFLRDHTPAEVEAYVQANVTDLASARQMMKKFAVVLCVLAKKEFR